MIDFLRDNRELVTIAAFVLPTAIVWAVQSDRFFRRNDQ